MGEAEVRRSSMASLILKRASASRPSGEWNEDDFDVVADGAQPAPSSSHPRLLGEAR
jgi:hypothetical protein